MKYWEQSPNHSGSFCAKTRAKLASVLCPESCPKTSPVKISEVALSKVKANTIGQLQESDEPKALKLAELLRQLQTVIEADNDLPPKNKEKALKQVKALAEAPQNSKEEEKQDLADTAITMLKGIIAGLPGAAALVEACNKLLPALTSLLGLA